ncbi:MAG: energy-coupled thiamine transporter ThiT [Mycobacterium leprae]
MRIARSNLRVLVEAAVMIALAAALSQIPLFKMPEGGTVTPGSMVPILLIALRYGTGWGTLAGVALGLVNLIVNPYVVHPVQMLLEYPIAFGVLGLAGLARGRSDRIAGLLGSLALFGRFLAHFIAGVVFFASYTPPGWNVWVYSAAYNGSYMLPEMMISGLLLVLLLPALRRALPPVVE